MVELKPAEKVVLAALQSGHRIATEFRKEHGREPTDAELRIALTQLIEYNRRKPWK